MPELPEVETTRSGIEPHLLGNKIKEVIIRRRDLRISIPPALSSIEKLRVTKVLRRAKYLIISLEKNHHAIIHLGMSGALRIVDPASEFRTHDHVAFTISNGKQLRFHDPRRFGIVTHFISTDPFSHELFRHLGPEPLEPEFDAAYLKNVWKSIARPVKVALMDNAFVVGVGNIYASESLFHAGIHPATPAQTLSMPRIKKLVTSVKNVLLKSIEQGGTTLRDFLRENGQPGYFRQDLSVYEREGQLCKKCNSAIIKITQAQRSSYYCPSCQKK